MMLSPRFLPYSVPKRYYEVPESTPIGVLSFYILVYKKRNRLLLLCDSEVFDFGSHFICRRIFIGGGNFGVLRIFIRILLRTS